MPYECPSPQANAVEDAQLKINVPFIKLALAKEWGPYVKFQWNKTLDDRCVDTNATSWGCVPDVLGKARCLPGHGEFSFETCSGSCGKTPLLFPPQ